MDNLIKISDRLPTKDEYPVVWVDIRDGDYYSVNASFADIRPYVDEGINLTHWIPLPKIIKE